MRFVQHIINLSQKNPRRKKSPAVLSNEQSKPKQAGHCFFGGEYGSEFVDAGDDDSVFIGMICGTVAHLEDDVAAIQTSKSQSPQHQQ